VTLQIKIGCRKVNLSSSGKIAKHVLSLHCAKMLGENHFFSGFGFVPAFLYSLPSTAKEECNKHDLTAAPCF
jgi:hypothetical protein